MSFPVLTVLRSYISSCNRYLCVIAVLLSTAVHAASAPAAPVPLLPADLSTLIAAAIYNHPLAQGAQAKRRAALQDVAVAERSKWPTLSAVTESKVGGVRAASQAATLRIEQTLWDYGAGNERISATVTAADITEVQVILEQHDLAEIERALCRVLAIKTK